jgi:tetratricopeptide (TPR) repeat protein
MNYGQVIQRINSSLTGDAEKDMEFLRSQIYEYRDHSSAREIAKTCIQIMWELTPDAKVIADSKKRALKKDEQPWRGIDADYEEARLNKFQRHYDTALQISNELVRKVESLDLFKEDEESIYKSFAEPFEELLYVALYEPKKILRRAPLPYVDIYYQNGGFNMDSKRYKEAAESFRKAIDWCPVNPMPMFEYLETIKTLGDNGEYKKIADYVFKISFTPAMLGKSYRYMGYWYLKKKEWDAATACYQMSLKYSNLNGAAQRELGYIRFRTFGRSTDMSDSQMYRICEDYGIPYGPDPLIISMAHENGELSLEKGKNEQAIYYFNIEQKLTGDKELKERILDLY